MTTTFFLSRRTASQLAAICELILKPFGKDMLTSRGASTEGQIIYRIEPEGGQTFAIKGVQRYLSAMEQERLLFRSGGSVMCV